MPSVNPTATSAPAVDPIAVRLSDLHDLALPEAFRRVCEAAADALDVERVGVWLLTGETRTLRCVSLYERSKRRHSKGACLHLAEFPAFDRAVTTAPLLACPAARTDPRTADLGDTYLAPHGVTAVLDAPLVRDGRVIGVATHEHVGPPREWTEDEKAYALAVAELLVARMRAAEGILRATPGAIPGLPRQPRGAAHAFRNLLSEILAHAELGARAPGVPPAAADRFARIIAAADHGVELVRTLLEPPPSDPPAPLRIAQAPPLTDDTGEHEPLPPDSDG